MAFSSNKILRGTFGKVWFDGERMANVKSFEAKVSKSYEDVDVNGDMMTHHREIKKGLSGTMTLHKFDSYILSSYLKNDNDPDITVVVELADPQVDGSQRVALYGVHIEEFTLAKFENGTMLEEEVPFNADGYEILDTI